MVLESRLMKYSSGFFHVALRGGQGIRQGGAGLPLLVGELRQHRAAQGKRIKKGRLALSFLLV